MTTHDRTDEGRGRRGLALAVILLGALLAGCGEDLSPREYIDRALSHRADGEHRAAIIELRNALREQPDHGAARALLGRIYVEIEDMPAAEKELRRALELGVSSEDLIIDLGVALLRQGSPEQVLEEVRVRGDWPDELRAAGHGLRARAHVAQGDHLRAREALNHAEETGVRALQVALGEIALARALGRTDEARRRADEAVENYPESVAAWRAKARLAFMRGDVATGREAASRAIELAANPAEDYLLRARLRVAEGDLEGAREDLSALGNDRAGHPRVRFIRALIAWAEEEYKKACEELQEAVSGAPEYVEARYYLGACQFRAGALNQAEAHLQWVNQRQPEPAVALLLGRTRLALDQPGEAREAVRPVVQRHPGDTSALALMARIEMESGNTAEAIDYLQRLGRLKPDDPGVKLQLGMGLLQSGQLAAGRVAFSEALDLDPRSDRAGEMLVMTHLQAGDYDKALEQARAMAESQPDSALPWTLTALVHSARGENAATRDALASALERDPADPAARHFLARLDMQAGDMDSAREQLDAVLEERPGHVGTLIALANLEARAGNPGRAEDRLLEAHQSDPDALRPRVLLARLRLQRGNPGGALELLAGEDGAVPSDATALVIAGRAHLALGQPARAIENLTRLISVDPGAVGARLLLGRAYAAAGDAEAAIEQVEKELAANPDNVEAQIVMARARLQQGREPEARKLIAALPDQAAGRPLALETRAMLAMNAGDFPAAVDAYRRLLEVVPAGGYVIKLATALRRAGRTDEAVTVLDEWLNRNPDDAPVWLAAGDIQLLLGNEAKAISSYRSALEADPGSAAAMNNIAWLLRERDPDEALRLAEKAVELQPASAALRDTLGMVLLARGEPEAAVESFRAGLERAPDAPDLNYHLARALVAAGRQDEAREPLRRALESGTSFGERRKAEALLDELNEGS